MFRTRTIYWSIRSESDPRWNYSSEFESVSVLYKPDEFHKKIEELEGLYGEMPDDLTYSCMKD